MILHHLQYAIVVLIVGDIILLISGYMEFILDTLYGAYTERFRISHSLAAEYYTKEQSMSCQNSAQLVKAVILVIVLVGCSTPKTPIALATLPHIPTPTQVPTATLNPTTSVKISSFGECFALGYRIQNTYPRQCINNIGEIFTETLDEGMIFSKTYGNHEGRFITSTNDGGHLIAGESTGCWILKLDANSEKAWDASFSQELSKEFQLENATFWCWLARQTPDGNYVAMGTGYDANFGQFRKTFTITLDHQGNLVSGQLIAERGTKTPYLARDGNLVWLTSLGIPREVRETLDGGYMIVGHFEQSSPDSSMHMIKTDKNGAYVWDRNLCLDKNIHQAWKERIVCSYSYVLDVIQLQDGSFVMTGIGNGVWLLKTDPNGNVEWMQSYEQESGDGHALIQMPDGGYLIAGEKYIDRKQIDGMLIKTDSEGNLQWLRTYGGDKDDRFMAMEERPNGEVIIMGSTESFGAGTYLWLLGMDSGIFK